MKKILSLLAATILALCSFYSTCWYAPYNGYSYITLLIVAVLFLYMVLIYTLFRIRSQKGLEKENKEIASQV